MNTKQLHILTSLNTPPIPSGNEKPELRQYLQQIAKVAVESFAPDICRVFAINPLTGKFAGEPISLNKDLSVEAIDFRKPSPHGLAAKAVKDGLILVKDASTSKNPDYQNQFVKTYKIESFAAFALYEERTNCSRPLAVVYINYKTQKSFDTNFIEDMEFFIRQASISLQKTWLLRRYHDVAEIGLHINAELSNIDKLFDKLKIEAADILDVSHFFMLAVYVAEIDKFDLYIIEKGNVDIRHGFSADHSALTYWAMNKGSGIRFGNLSKEGKDLPKEFKPIYIEKTLKGEESLVFAPLRYLDRSLGVLSIQHTELFHFDEEDEQILQLLANHVALALNNINLLEDLHTVMASEQLLTQHLGHGEALLNMVAKQIFDTTKADIVTLFPYSREQDKFKLPPILKGDLLNPDFPPRSEIKSDDIVALAIKREQPLFAPTIKNLYRDLGGDLGVRQGGFENREKVKSTAVVPLRISDEPVGVLFINFREPRRFAEPTRRLIGSLATTAALAIRNSRIFSSLHERRLEELQELQNIDKDIIMTLDKDAVLKKILNISYEGTKADTGVILLHNKEKNQIEAVAQTESVSVLPEQQVYSLDSFTGLAKKAFVKKNRY